MAHHVNAVGEVPAERRYRTDLPLRSHQRGETDAPPYGFFGSTALHGHGQPCKPSHVLILGRADDGVHAIFLRQSSRWGRDGIRRHSTVFAALTCHADV